MSQVQDFGDRKMQYCSTLPIIVTTAPCMMSYDGDAKEWFDMIRGKTPNYGYGLNSGDIVMAIQAVEMTKQPSLVLNLPQGMTVRPDTLQDGCCCVVNGPSGFPQRAMQGRLRNWKLWAVEFCGDRGIWLNFVNTTSFLAESWRLLPGDGFEKIHELSILTPDKHRFAYYNYVNESIKEYDASEAAKFNNNGYEKLIREFTLHPADSTYVVEELE